MSVCESELCPQCGSKRVIRIAYGLPGLSLLGQADRNEVELGGCTSTNESPNRACRSCRHRWLETTDAQYIAKFARHPMLPPEN